MEGVVTESFNDAEGIRKNSNYPESNAINEDSKESPQGILSEDIESNVQSSEPEE